MNRFSIDLDNNEFKFEGDTVVPGLLKINNFSEKFHASLSYWDRDRYLLQWKEALDRIKYGEKNSAVITTMYDPSTANFIFWWVLYLLGNKVYIQNHVLFLEELKCPFNEADLYSFIPERETKTEEGESISEWVVEIEDIQECADSLKIYN